jgi:hypothetical protein
VYRPDTLRAGYVIGKDASAEYLTTGKTQEKNGKTYYGINVINHTQADGREGSYGEGYIDLDTYNRLFGETITA